MIKKTLPALCILLICAACTSEIKRLKETEYLRTQPGKPLIYPEDVEKPVLEKTFVIPEPSRSATADAEAEAPELLVLPPRLAGVELVEDTAEDAAGESGAGGVKSGSADEGFLESP